MTDRRRFPVARNETNRIVIPVEHVLVLVGGTVDAGNLFDDKNIPPGKEHETATYSGGYSAGGERSNDPAYWARPLKPFGDALDPNWYWQDNPDLRRAIYELVQQYRNLHLFHFHGWSGDNSPLNRQIAGHYLCNRLFGGGEEQAFYPAWLNKPVYIHLMGHSHGGNVINEFTRCAAEAPNWPAKWKIRSVTYQSTPFFQKLHQPKTDRFHPDCPVLNVFNKFDLTQRVIADFSLFQLNGLLDVAEVEVLAQLAGKITFKEQWVPHLNWDWLSTMAVAPESGDTLYGLFWEPKRATAMYAGVIELLVNLDALLEAVLRSIDNLEKGIVFPMAQQLAMKACAGRRVMSPGLARRFRAELQKIRDGIKPTLAAFRARLADGVFPVSGLVSDAHVNTFLGPLAEIVHVNSATLRGRLWGLVFELATESVDVFDDTKASPATQLQSSPFVSHVIHVDVTQYDDYGNNALALPYSRHYDRFVSRLEGLEAKYAANGEYRDLMDIVFTILAQVSPLAKQLDDLESKCQTVLTWTPNQHLIPGADFKQFARIVTDLARSLLAYRQIFRSRNAALQVPEEAMKAQNGWPPFGGLGYLMRVSHSVSRRDLYPDVRDTLEKTLQPVRLAQ